ncbi:MAG: hypothetical protein IJM05_06550 [Bacteroidales bacterium]|nr:hypothetical protein [Bacteroidales bacterium]
MKHDDLNLWWTSLSVAQKERVAKKGLKKYAGEKEPAENEYQYPACTIWWNNLPEEQKTWIHDHCVNKHGYVLQEWDEANPYGD